MNKVVVLGSLNIDLVLGSERLPKIGETIHGKQIDYMFGGKGANQAVACARVGANTTMIGCVGDDTFGNKILSNLKRENIPTDKIQVNKNTFTGIATVFNINHDNAIVVIPGANENCNCDLVDEYMETIKDADVLLIQLEIPLKTVEYALMKAKEFGLKTILNPAPYMKLNHAIFNYVDYITPNETEFESMIEKVIHDEKELELEMKRWVHKNKTNLIVTRGSKGSSFVENENIINVANISVDVVDTTGAGDTFNGILAQGIANQLDLKKCVEYAGIGASISVSAFGAQSGMPSMAQIKNKLNSK